MWQIIAMKNTLLLLLLLLNQHLFAQDLLSFAKKEIIPSSFLQTDREIWIRIPDSYTNKQVQAVEYPVIYVLDAETNFMHHSSIVQRFEMGHYPLMAESIVIGITNKNGDRTKDFTPINDEAFSNFIGKELIPFIQKNYRTNGFKTLIGHSLGGLFALKTLIDTPTMFQAYVAHDPSIWHGDLAILKRYQQEEKKFNNRFLMITQAGESEDSGQLKIHYKGIKDIHSLLLKQKDLHYNYKQYTEEDHGSVPMIGTVDFLRWLFKGYAINIKVLKDNPLLIDETFKAFSQKMNTPFLPSESYLQLVAKYMVRIKEYDLAEYYFHQRYSLFPNSEQAQKDLTDFCQSKSPNPIK